jgi:HEPN domain-containing protein
MMARRSGPGQAWRRGVTLRDMSGLAKAMWRQSARDLDHARESLRLGHHEWATYSAQQAAEKGAKAVLLEAGLPTPRIHALSGLLQALVHGGLATPEERQRLQPLLRILDQGFAVSRYPLADLEMAPADLIGEEQAAAAIAAAEGVLQFLGSRGGAGP